MPFPPITVVETPTFRTKARKLLTEEEALELVAFLAGNPESGDVMQGTGGVRKLRWSRENTGKSAGFRVIYYYYDQSVPLFALTLYPKNEKADLTQAEKNELKKLSSILAAHYKAEVRKNVRRSK